MGVAWKGEDSKGFERSSGALVVSKSTGSFCCSTGRACGELTELTEEWLLGTSPLRRSSVASPGAAPTTPPTFLVTGLTLVDTEGGGARCGKIVRALLGFPALPFSPGDKVCVSGRDDVLYK